MIIDTDKSEDKSVLRSRTCINKQTNKEQQTEWLHSIALSNNIIVPIMPFLLTFVMSRAFVLGYSLVREYALYDSLGEMRYVDFVSALFYKPVFAGMWDPCFFFSFLLSRGGRDYILYIHTCIHVRSIPYSVLLRHEEDPHFLNVDCRVNFWSDMWWGSTSLLSDRDEKRWNQRHDSTQWIWMSISMEMEVKYSVLLN